MGTVRILSWVLGEYRWRALRRRRNGNVPDINVQALAALGFFLVALALARMVALVRNGSLPGGSLGVGYLRSLVGFFFTGALVLGFYAMAGVSLWRR